MAKDEEVKSDETEVAEEATKPRRLKAMSEKEFDAKFDAAAEKWINSDHWQRTILGSTTGGVRAVERSLLSFKELIKEELQ